MLLTECGFCSIGTPVMVHPDATLYAQVPISDVAEIVEQHIEKGIVIKRLASENLVISRKLRHITKVRSYRESW